MSVSLGIIESEKKLRRKLDNSAGDYIIHNAPQGGLGGVRRGQGNVAFRARGPSRGSLRVLRFRR